LIGSSGGTQKVLPNHHFLCLVLSTKLYDDPFGPGGKGSPLTDVTSVLVFVLRYCPDTGAFLPDLNPFILAIYNTSFPNGLVNDILTIG
jgi:hypothetical protein